MLHNIKISGKSGCPISIVGGEFGFSIIKRSKDVNYTHRLKKQAAKQALFYAEKPSHLPFFTPKITAQRNVDGIGEIEMEYINAESYSTFLIKQSKNGLDKFISNLVAYFKFYQTNTTTLTFTEHQPIFRSKVADLELAFQSIHSIHQGILQLITHYLYNNIPNQPIPIGTCHGDFTLSNMLFSNNQKVYLIDFLDSFIESPWVDYIKLRQDTRYYWSSYLESKDDTPNVRLLQALTYIDGNVSKIITSQYPEILIWEQYLTVLNFARIIPYANSESDYTYLFKKIKLLLN